VFDQERSETDKTSEDPMKRAQHLREVCDQLDKLGQVPIELERHSYQYMYVNDEYKFIFCMMPKLACTNWKRVFLALNDIPNKNYIMNELYSRHVHGMHGQHAKTLNKYSQPEIQERLQTYKKIIFVRDPFERILSAFKDKMFRNDSSVFRDIAKKIIQLKRRDGTPKTGNVKFLEFVQYLTDPDTFQSSYDQHWAKYIHLSQPCILRYDFIGKFETMDADVDLAFKYMGIDGIVKFPQREAAYKDTKRSDIVQLYYKQLPEHYLRKLWKLLKNDFILFSYPLPELLSELSNI
jgi:hypothetical protein